MYIEDNLYYCFYIYIDYKIILVDPHLSHVNYIIHFENFSFHIHSVLTDNMYTS